MSTDQTTQETYAAATREKPFDWHEALESPETYDQDYLEEKAGRWTTCACGNLCAALPRKKDGSPEDRRLSMLGILFYSHIENRHWALARRTLVRIEERSTYLLRELGILSKP